MKTLACIVTAFALTACPSPDLPQSNGNQSPGQQQGGENANNNNGGSPSGGAQGGGSPGGKNPTGTKPDRTAQTLKHDKAPPDQEYTQQSDVEAGDFVTFSGTVNCNDCTQVVISVKKPPSGEGGTESSDDLITQKSVNVEDSNSFKISIPKGDANVVLELTADNNPKDDKPSQGEFFVSDDGAGDQKPNQDKSGLSYTIGNEPDQAPGDDGKK